MTDVLIFDDDPYVGHLMEDLVRSLGVEVKHYQDGKDALERIREEKPRVVLADLMMPGLDGISICVSVRKDPELSGTKMAIVTGKGFQEDKEKALKEAGADLYIEKPFDLQQFTRSVNGLLESGSAAAKSDPGSKWHLKVWGQGVPGVVSLRVGEDLFVLDAGRNLENLASDRAAWAPAKKVWLLLSHYHQSHIAGLAHAAEWLRAGLALHVAGPWDVSQPLSGRVLQEMGASGLSHEELRTRIRFSELREGDLLPDCPLRVEALSTMHPGFCLAFSLDGGGRKVIFVPDNELHSVWEGGDLGPEEKLSRFAAKADLLLHDARYSDADHPRFAGQGHSCPTEAFRLAKHAGVKRLMLYHVDARYDEAGRKDIHSAAAAASAKSDGPECLLADDGRELQF